MSNRIDHGIISGKLEALFESAEENLKARGMSEKDIKFTEYKLGDTKASFCEGEMIHLDVDNPDSITILRKKESREYLLINVGEEREVARFNTCDDPSIQVYLGNTASEHNTILKDIDSTKEEIKNDTKLILEVKKSLENDKPKSNRNSSNRM